MKWTEEHRANHRAAFERHKGAAHWNWKGDSAGYKSIHEWLRVNHGTHATCEHCGEFGFIEYASKRKVFIRDIKEWLKLCRSCHKKFDGIITNIIGI